MSEAALRSPASGMDLRLPLVLLLGWRNLWRNLRRTVLTAAGVGFAVFLVVSAMCIQLGSYATMEETATALLVGHAQLQNAAYADDERLEDNLAGAAELQRRVAAVPGVAAVAPRVEAFALASAGERSFGAQVVGVDPVAESRVVTFEERVYSGSGLRAADDGVLGEALARNLGVGLGDEVVLLGTASRGGVAALVLTVRGLFRTGIAEIDRSLLLADIGAVREAFGLTDRVHRLVLRTDDLGQVEQVAERLQQALPARWPESADRPATLEVRIWSDVLPDLRQAIEIDRISGQLFYWIIIVLVAFSVVNTFIMTVFERTREFGMMLAIGMRPRRIVVMLQWEAAFMWALGTGIGLALAVLLIAWLSRSGIYLGAELERMASEMYMPTRLYPAFTAEALVTAPLVMFLGTQIAAVLPSLRLRRLRPVDALRVTA